MILSNLSVGGIKMRIVVVKLPKIFGGVIKKVLGIS